jgi:hypothetical protein
MVEAGRAGASALLIFTSSLTFNEYVVPSQNTNLLRFGLTTLSLLLPGDTLKRGEKHGTRSACHGLLFYAEAVEENHGASLTHSLSLPRI